MHELALVLLDGGEADDDRAAAALGLVVARADVHQGLDGLGDGGDADLGVLELAVAVLEQELHLVAVEEEVLGATDLDEEVMVVDARAELDLLHARSALLVLVLLGLFVEVLAVFLQLADGRHGGRGDLDQVDAEFAGEVERLLRGHDAHHLALGGDDAHFGRADAIVALRPFVFFAEVAAILPRVVLRAGAVRTIGRRH